MHRMILAIAVAIAALAFGARGASAREAPWCAISPMGPGDVIKDCVYWSLEACVPYVIAGNRGFCNLNPRFVGPLPKTRPKHRARRR
jgi:Protein of unknown function (DUF3551)